MGVFLAMTTVAVARKFHIHRVPGGMARLANDLLVGACQRIFSLARMIVAPARPSVRIVAISTLGSEASLVFVLVAFFAGHGLGLIRRRPMTFFTRNRSVQPDQRKARNVMIKCGVLTPIDSIVTLFTSRAEFVLMWVVLLVTRDASYRQFLAIDVARMARITFSFLVCAAKRILGLVVIEPHGFPFDLIMARFAFRTVPVGMDVLQAVARHASTREIFVYLAHMTGRTIDVPMGAFQREFGLAMIVRLRLSPFRLGMTAVAFFAQTTLVRVD